MRPCSTPGCLGSAKRPSAAGTAADTGQAPAVLGASSPRRFSAQKPSSFSLPPAQARSALGEHSGYTKQLKQNPGVLVSVTSCGNSPLKAAGFLLHTKGKSYKARN